LIKAKTAIAKRGWGPLNYALMDHPALHDDIQNKSRRECVDISCINTSKGVAAVMFDKLIENKSKDDKRIEILRKRKEEVEKMTSEAEKLRSLTGISSGQLSGVGKYNICSGT
jgi:hypothetical protein